MTKDSHLDIPTVHWADHAAEELIESNPGKNTFVCASGISPSGWVHIGNFREVITVDLVARSLRRKGKQVRFIYSWDDYDALRKVPANLPQPELIQQNLRKPLALVPDPFGKAPSYAAHFESHFEKSLAPLEIQPEYIRQNERYRRGDYARGIKTALESQQVIVSILNQFRSEPLPSDWSCLSVFCAKCEKDTTTVTRYEAPHTVHYQCENCPGDFTSDFSQPNSGVKLLWRVDWPMRWAEETVDFEPGGKDHSSTGGSYETGALIAKAVWKRNAPFYVQYDFVIVKGGGAKLSSSSGQLITLEEALAVYEPSVLRWIFASRKPNTDFSIAFDLDVIKAYDDFDRTTRIALGNEPADEKKRVYEQRIYELSRTSDYPSSESGDPSTSAQFSFRHLCNVLQIHNGDISKAKNYYAKSLTDAKLEKLFKSRAQCAWTWITQYAPVEFRFQLRDASQEVPKTTFPSALEEVVRVLEKPGVEDSKEEDLHGQIYQVIKHHGLEPKAFFQELYYVLIGKPQGPKLASFFLAMGPANAAGRLRKAL